MNWTNVKLIFQRETRDQLRDRRTLFTVVVMPLILYPLIGVAMLQVAQFTREYPTRIWIVGHENLPGNPALVDGEQFASQWTNDVDTGLLDLRIAEPGDRRFTQLIEHFKENPQEADGSRIVDQLMDQRMRQQGMDLAIFVPRPVPKYVSINEEYPDADEEVTGEAPAPKIWMFYNSARDKSRIAAERAGKILSQWKTAYVGQSLNHHDVPTEILAGMKISTADVADGAGRRSATWSKLLPFIIIIWALTGAFYPAIDLCAGEKERGTLETLLCSPAGRDEIAIGKLLTVMSFSMATSLLNLASMGFTGLYVMSKLGAGMGGISLGSPTLASIGWLLVALIPISALFSAVALAAASFARSSKEGQYYLIPLLMISMPLMMVPMLPAAKLDLGTSLIPISGLMLLLRGLIEGNYADVLPFVGPVCLVTLAGCYVSIRWVVWQFNSESVLFRASERFGVGVWFQQVIRQREMLPSIGAAVMLGVTVLVLKFFLQLTGVTVDTWFGMTKVTLIVLVATIAVPTILMACFLTRDPLRSLRLKWCSVPAACAAVLAAICLHPAVMWFSGLVMQVYPPGPETEMMAKLMDQILGGAPGLWAILLVMAVAPAVIEELGYRGFILSGMESIGNKWQAILLTSLLFGLAHSVIQQTMITFVVGMVLGVIAVQTRSILPCMLYHATHNGLSIMLSRVRTDAVETSPLLQQLLQSSDGQSYQYSMTAGIVMTAFGVALMVWFLKQPAVDSRSGHNDAHAIPASNQSVPTTV